MILTICFRVKQLQESNAKQSYGIIPLLTTLGTMRTYDSLQGIATAFLLDRETE